MDFGYLIDQYVKSEVKSEVEREVNIRLEREVNIRLEHEVKSRVEREREETTKDTLHDAILDLLNDKGTVPEDLQIKLNEVTDPERLRSLHLLASRSQSVEEFAQKIDE